MLLGSDVLSVLGALPHPVAILDLSSNGRACFLNRAFSRVFGYTLADVPTPEAWAERAYTDASYRHSVMEWMWSEIALMQTLGKVSLPTEQMIQTKMGEVLTTMVGLSLHKDFLIITFQDITKERSAEAALAEERRKTEATAYALTENMPAGAYTAVMTPGAIYPQFKFLSRKVLEIFDVERATAEADPSVLLDRMHPEDRRRWFENSAEARRTLSIFSSDARVSVQGHTRWIRAEAAPRQISTGETLWEGIIVDITELKEAERRLQSVLVTAKAYAWRYNLKEKYTEICERWAEISGFDRGMRRLPYSVSLEKLHPDDTARVAAAFAALSTGVIERQELTFRWLLEDGRWIWLRVQCGIGARDETGEPTAISGISFDITREMNRFLETQEAQAKLREDLQRAQQRDIVAQVAGRVVHDLNNLIFVISGTANMLDEISDSSEELQLGLKRIRRAVALSSDLIGDLDRLSSPKQAAENLDLCEMLRDGLDLVGSLRATKHHIQLEMPKTPIMIWANKTELAQVIVNLAINACDSGTAAQPANVTICALPSGTCIPVRPPEAGKLCEDNVSLALFTISDTGRGIAPDALSRIFRPHYTTKGKLGTGLGLPIVAAILKSNSAALWVDSVPGAGTVMTIAWPAKAPSKWANETDDSGQRRDKGLAKIQGWPLENMSVLIVDDVPDIADVLANMLESAGAMVHAVSDAKQAKVMLMDPSIHVSVLVTDQNMPAVSGFELATLAAQRQPPVPAVLVTARPETLSKRKCAAFVEVLPKPVTSETLVRSVFGAATNARVAPPQ